MTEKPEVMLKISPVLGDITRPNFDLSDEHLQHAIETTQILFHLAASLDLEASLKPNVIVNLVGTQNTLELAKKMTKLTQMVHLSTAFCNLEPKVVYERVHDFPQRPEDLIKRAKTMGAEAMAKMQKDVLGVHPNTYTYTKRLAEVLVRDQYENIPLCIVRPSIVTPALFEPLPGWVNSLSNTYLKPDFYFKSFH